MDEQFRLVVAQNAAANGRTFCILLFAACIAVYFETRDSFYLTLSLVAAFPIALAYIGDLFASPFQRRVIGVMSFAIPAAVIVNLLAV